MYGFEVPRTGQTVSPVGFSKKCAAVFIFGLLWISNCLAQGTSKKTPQQEYWIAFDRVGAGSGLKHDVDLDVYVVDADGKHTKRLTSDHQSHNPSWSPDGRQIAYIRDASSIKTVSYGSSSSSGRTHSGSDWDPFSPDAPYETFAKFGDFLSMRRAVMRMSSDGKNGSLIVSLGPDTRDVLWLPDGNHVAVRLSHRRDLRIRIQAYGQALPDFITKEPLIQYIDNLKPSMSASVHPPNALEFVPYADNFLPIFYAHLADEIDGGMNYPLLRPMMASPDRHASQSIVPLDGSHSSLSAPAFDASWSRDGKRIAYSTFSGGKNSVLYVAAMDGTNVVNPQPVTDESLDAHDPAWAADGSRIALSGMWRTSSQIFMIDSDGRNLVQLSRNPNLLCSHATWSPDGKWIAAACRPPQFTTDPIYNALGWDSNIYLFEVGKPGARPRRLTQCFKTAGCGAHNPSFAPAGTVAP